VEIPVARLISKEYAAQQRERIRRDQVTARNMPPLSSEGTTSLAAADKWGNIVVFTQSLMGGFGSGVVVPGTGLVLNNGHQLGFVLTEGHVNRVVGGQHAKGVMSPTLALKDGKAVLGIGASGGYTIPQTVGQALTKALVYGFDVQQAIASPRVIVSQGERGTRTYADVEFPVDVAEGLKRLGHTLSEPGNMGAVQGVAIDPEMGTLSAGADPRRDGHPLAY
jgi:gamma-glutamyltranspeptidase/glutathione hydrolase